VNWPMNTFLQFYGTIDQTARTNRTIPEIIVASSHYQKVREDASGSGTGIFGEGPKI